MGRRDERDSTRADSPLKPAIDAEIIDTSGMSLEQQIDVVLKLAHKRFGIKE